MTAKLRLKNLRELVNAYQKWKERHQKDFKELDEYYFSVKTSPLKSVVSLIKAKLSSKDLELCLKNHVNRASQRIIRLQVTTFLFEHIINTPFERYIFGLLTQTFTDDYLTNVSCSPREFEQVLEQFSIQVLEKYLVSLNAKMEGIKSIKLNHLNSLITKTKSISNGLLKWKSIIQQSSLGLSCNFRAGNVRSLSLHVLIAWLSEPLRDRKRQKCCLRSLAETERDKRAVSGDSQRQKETKRAVSGDRERQRETRETTQRDRERQRETRETRREPQRDRESLKEPQRDKNKKFLYKNFMLFLLRMHEFTCDFHTFPLPNYNIIDSIKLIFA